MAQINMCIVEELIHSREILPQLCNSLQANRVKRQVDVGLANVSLSAGCGNVNNFVNIVTSTHCSQVTNQIKHILYAYKENKLPSCAT